MTAHPDLALWYATKLRVIFDGLTTKLVTGEDYVHDLQAASELLSLLVDLDEDPDHNYEHVDSPGDDPEVKPTNESLVPVTEHFVVITAGDDPEVGLPEGRQFASYDEAVAGFESLKAMSQGEVSWILAENTEDGLWNLRTYIPIEPQDD